MYAICDFVHLYDEFTAGQKVDPEHPMVALRPDLFTTTKPKPSKKEAPE